MLGIYSQQPIDRNGNQIEPEQAVAFPAITQATSGALVSSMVVLDGRATTVEIATTGGAAGLKWWGSVIGSDNIHPSMTTSNYDNVIPANWIRRFAIPQSVIGVATVGSIVGGYGKQNGLYHQFTVIPLGAGALATSIFTSQYV